MTKLLFTGGGGAGSEALVRLLSQKYEVHLADADRQALPPIASETQCHAIPLAGKDWAQGLATLCKRIGVQILIPTVDEELLHVPELRLLSPNLLILTPTPEFVQTMNDKLLFFEALSKAGIDTPRTEILSEHTSIKFPCLAKPRHGRGSRGIQKLHTTAEIAAYELLSHQAADQLLLQEFFDGQEWTVYVSVNKNGALQSIVPVKVELKRGITIRAQTSEQKGIETLCRQIHEKFPTTGCYNVQLMETSDGRLVVFEINPRVSTTLCLAIEAGADPIEEYLSESDSSLLRPFRSSVRLQRNWFNHIS